MATVFGILTAITLAIAAFFSFKNKEAYESSIAKTATERGTMEAAEVRLRAAKDVLADLPSQIEAVEVEIKQLTETETQQGLENETQKKQNDEKAATVASNKGKLDAVREKTEKTGDLKGIASKMRATNAELSELDQSIASAEAQLANLTAQDSSSKAQVIQTKDNLEAFTKENSIASLQTRIRSIYPNWGFVTLASGNNAGVVTNSTLDVIRDGQVIAKLLVTAVETSTSSASIVPDSMGADVTLMVGDRVVPGVKATAAATN